MGEPSGPAAVNDAIQRGFYFRLLNDWLHHFDRRQLHILQYERCASDPVGQLRSTFHFLGLEEAELAHRPPEQPAAVRTGNDETSLDLDPTVRKRLVSLYSSDVVSLARTLPSIDLGLWPNFAHLSPGPGPAGDDAPPTAGST